MDSITQAALGAAVAEAGLGRKLGNKAILWGALLGTMPDLDVLASPFLDAVTRLSWHRGLTHSLLFAVLASPVLAWLMHRIHGEKCPVLRGSVVVFLVLSTHTLIDCFTVYGTQIFEPFSNQRVGFNNLFIIDPLYTLPLLVGLGIAFFRSPASRLRRWANYAGLLLSSLYVLWSFGAKAVADDRFHQALADKGVTATQYMSGPGLFNTVTWRVVAGDANGFWIGRLNLFRPDDPIEFQFLPRNENLLAKWRDSRLVRQLVWFSQGFYALEQVDPGTVAFRDLRFNERRDRTGQVRAVFVWRIQTSGEEPQLAPSR